MEKNSRIEELKKQYLHAREIGESIYHDIADLLDYINYMEAQLEKYEKLFKEIDDHIGPANFVTYVKSV